MSLKNLLRKMKQAASWSLERPITTSRAQRGEQNTTCTVFRLVTRKVCVDKIQTAATRKVCGDKIQIGGECLLTFPTSNRQFLPDRPIENA